MSAKSENPLGWEKIPPLLKRFAIPSIIAMLVGSLYNIVDQIFIGQGVGYLGNAATNVAFPLSTICLAIGLLIGVGSSSQFSLYLGANEKRNAAHIVGNAVTLMLISGIMLTLLIEIFLTSLLNIFGATPDVMPYAASYTRITALGMPLMIGTKTMSCLARSDGSPDYSMQCMLIGAIINVILDPIFIFILQMGVTGAAIATVVGQLVSFIMAIRYLKKFKHIRLEKEDFYLRLPFLRSITALGMSGSLNQIALTLVQIVMNNSLTYYGGLSEYGKEIPLAACGIVMKINAILQSVIIGISQGTQPIIGFNYGAKQYERVKQTYWLAIKYNLLLSATGFLIFQLFPRQLLSLFGEGNSMYFQFSIRFLRIFLFMVMVNGVQLISSSFFTAIGKPGKGLFLSLTRQVIFLIPLLLILPVFMEMDGIMFAGPIADFIAFLVTTIFMIQELKSTK